MSPLVVDPELCDPKYCEIICVKKCPVNKRNPDIKAISFNGKASINTDHCTRCSLCMNNCPENAISGISIKQMKKVEIDVFSNIELEVWKKSDYIVNNEMHSRFAESDTIFSRVENDPTYERYQEGVYSKVDEILKMNKLGYSKVDMALTAGSWVGYNKFPEAFEYKKGKGEKIDIEKSELSRIVKQTAKSFGAAIVGITRVKKEWLYTHDRNGDINIIPEHLDNVIVMAIEMDLEALQTSPAPIGGFATGNGYSRMAFLQASLAEFIKELGYDALPAGNNKGLSVPMAIDAGLGQYGRHGLLITEEFGSNVRICKIFTNMPLEHDKSKEFGVLDFCRTCMRCAQQCPSQSISYDKNPGWEGPTRSNNPGILKWYVNVESCYGFWVDNGGDCSNCISSCPFTKNRHWSHKIARYFIKKIPFLNWLWVKIDHWMGYGKQENHENFWKEDREFIHTR